MIKLQKLNPRSEKTEEKIMNSREGNSPSSSSDDEIRFSSPACSEDEGFLSDGTPVRPIFCLKKYTPNMKVFDEKDDCFILDFDPSEPVVDMSHLSLGNAATTVVDGGEDDIAVIAVKGKVACRDYPHPRHLCLNFPFNDSPHESYCKLCFCYVCDSPAPCKLWTKIQPGHCHATEHGEEWKFQRKIGTQSRKVAGMVQPVK